MLKLKKLSAGLALLAVFLAVGGWLPLAGAAEQSAGQGLEISPPLIERSVRPGESFTQAIKLRNVTNNTLSVTTTVNDFIAKGEDGQPQLLLNQAAAEEGPYSMRNWVAPVASFTLTPKEQEVFKVKINIPKGASPGGHYASIRFNAAAAGQAANQVGLTASIGNLVLLQVAGDIKVAASLEQFGVGKLGADGSLRSGSLFETGPLQLFERLKNTGNVHVKPKGKIVIKNLFGKEVATLEFNNAAGNVLPGSIRRFEQTLNKKLLFGRYSAALDLTYGSDQHLSGNFSFWVIPYKLVAVVVAAILVLMVLIMLGLRAYKKHILNTPPN